MKAPAATGLVGGEELLHGVSGVRAVVKNLGERGMARPDTGERIAQRICLLCGRLALLTQLRYTSLKSDNVLGERSKLSVCGFPVVGRLIGLVAKTYGSFEQLVFACFAFAKPLQVMDKRFFRLLLFAVQATKALAGFRCSVTQRFNPCFVL